MSTLLIKPLNTEIKEIYTNAKNTYKGDSGFDLYTPNEVHILPGETVFIPLQICCEMINNDCKNESFYLYPRSSISKTPLVLANSVGIIDSGYRGELKAAVKYIPSIDDLNSSIPKKYVIKKNTRLFQICKYNLESFSFKIVESLSDSLRGNNGFGSTGI